MLSISDEHKEAIIKLINSIISDTPVITNLTDRSKVNQKLVKLIHFFENSIDSDIDETNIILLKSMSFESLIENWLLHYYCEDSVMDSFAIEEGVEQELSTACLLVLYVIFKFTICLPHIVMYFNDYWIHLQELNANLDQMLKTDKIIGLLIKQIDTNVVNSSLNNYLSYHLNQANSGPGLNHPSHSDTQVKSLLNIRPKFVQNAGSSQESIVQQIIGQDLRLGQNEQTFKCGECKRQFGNKYKLNRHQFVHKPHIKPYKCVWEGCQQRFRSSFDVRRHLVTHTGERPFPCDICGRRFSRSDKLKEHKAIHNRQLEDKLMTADKTLAVNINPNDIQKTNISLNFEFNRSQGFSELETNPFSTHLQTFKSEFDF